MSDTVTAIKSLAQKRIEELHAELKSIAEQEKQLTSRHATVQSELDALHNIDSVMSGKYRGPKGAARPRRTAGAAGQPRQPRDGSTKQRVLDAIKSGVTTTEALMRAAAAPVK